MEEIIVHLKDRIMPVPIIPFLEREVFTDYSPFVLISDQPLQKIVLYEACSQRWGALFTTSEFAL